MKRLLHIDDSLDVFPVHGVGGVIGTLLTGVFAASRSAASAQVNHTMLAQLGVQAVGVVATARVVRPDRPRNPEAARRHGGPRVGPEQETEGLDLADHGERAYSE